MLYEGHLLDDYFMAVSNFIGLFFNGFLCYYFWPSLVITNLSGMLGVINITLLHASDERFGYLIFPLPRSLNFVAYHRIHHVD